jgi:hypothetical protein
MTLIEGSRREKEQSGGPPSWDQLGLSIDTHSWHEMKAREVCNELWISLSSIILYEVLQVRSDELTK